MLLRSVFPHRFQRLRWTSSATAQCRLLQCPRHCSSSSQNAPLSAAPRSFPRTGYIGDQPIYITYDQLRPEEMAKHIVKEQGAKGDENAFTLLNLDELYQRHALWHRELPDIMPFYAVKCNPDPVMIKVLGALGAGFDCASLTEINLVLNAGIPRDRIIFANPAKSPNSIAASASLGVRLTVADNEEELAKIARIDAHPQILLRLAANDPTAAYQLSLKFGVEVDNCPALLDAAKNMGLNIRGIAFHVGSNSHDPTAFRDAIHHSKHLLDYGAKIGHRMDMLDIGGGFNGGGEVFFQDVAKTINRALDVSLPKSRPRLISEPGRFMAATSFSVVSKIIAKKKVDGTVITKNPIDSGSPGFMYFLNDGIYGSFNNIFFDCARPQGFPLVEKEAPKYPSTIWGPTCDCIDLIEERKWMREMGDGEWLIYPNMGAYTTAACSTFNGFQPPKPKYYASKQLWDNILFPHLKQSQPK